ncbi:MAG: aromatic amino acid lyase, partial [Alphaproteobacteria bacterium]
MAAPFVLTPGGLALGDMRGLGSGAAVELDPACHDVIDRASAAVNDIVAGDYRVYGVNTGVGSLAKETISADMASEMQRRLIISHSAGTGPLLGDATVRRAIVMKINVLALGYSGVQRTLIDNLLTLLNADVLPCIPSKGSVGASGDLAPLAHMALILLGVGDARAGGEIISASEGLVRAGLEPIVFGAKEALCMINGT